MERRTFEDELKKAFQRAEVEPSEIVWTNIELDLEKANGRKMKRRIVFYKMLAAASVAFALCVAGIGYYTFTHQNQFGFGANQVALKSDASKTNHSGNDVNPDGAGADKDAAIAGNESLSSPDYYENQQAGVSQEINSEAQNKLTPKHRERNVASSNDTSKLTDSGANSSSANKSESNISTTHYPPQSVEKSAEIVLSETRVLPKLYTNQPPSLIFRSTKAETEPDPVALMFARLNDLEKELSQEKNEKKFSKNEKLWTSVGFAAGGFNTVNSNASSSPLNNYSLMSTSSSVVDKQSKASGTVYSAGISIGTSISKRWVVQGGVNYLTQLSDYTANEAFGSADFQTFKAVSLNEISRASSDQTEKLISTAPYTVNNNVQFISMPVQAGYLILNKKVGWQFNAGVATDLFLQNTINPEGGSLDKTTQGRGDDSPYRSVNFSGLVGTELSYRFAERYRISLNPGLRYPFNSIYKSNLGIEAMPLTFDVGLRFRYIFH